MIAPSSVRDGDIGRDDGSIRLDWFQSDTSDLDKLEGQGLHAKLFDALFGPFGTNRSGFQRGVSFFPTSLFPT
jgi:hypothetical protein